MQEIVVGRSKAGVDKFGLRGTVLLGKHYISMGQTTTLSNKIYMDVAGAHVMFICGKRGSGKSYTMGTVAEGFHLLDEDIKKNLCIILLDTMGIYWTMKYANHEDKDLLEEWDLKPKSIPVKIFTPEKYYEDYKKQGIPTDAPFTLTPYEIDSDDWCNAFRLDKYTAEGILHNIFSSILSEEFINL